MTPREAGHQQGVADARSAWVGTTWKRCDYHLPILHLDRQEWLAGYASGLAEFNRSIVVEA